MSVTLTYPGVYIQELKSGVMTIAGVATSIAAFVGGTARGPTDTPIVVNGYADFERVFGGMWSGSYVGFAVRDFFLNGGSQAIIVRIFAATSDQAAVDAGNSVASAASTEAAKPGATPDDVAGAIDDAITAAALAGSALAAAGKVKAAADAAVTAGAGADAVAKAAQAAVPAASDGHARLTIANAFTLEAREPGVWGNRLRIRIDRQSANKEAFFNLIVRDQASGATEMFRNIALSNANPATRIDRVLANGSRFVRVKADSLDGAARLPEEFPGAARGKSIWADNTASQALSGGDDGGTLSSKDFIGEGKDVAKLGLYALRDADLFNLLCIPPLSTVDWDLGSELRSEALAFCASRRAMMIVDPPLTWDSKEKAIAGVADLIDDNAKNAAIFFPRLLQPNPLHAGQVDAFPPCGAVAGVFARTDTTRGVWKAPAGLDARLGGVPQLDVPLTDMEVGELNPLAINCLRSMPAAGRVVWGARTLAGADRTPSDWKYIPVRRTALFIEESLYRATQWVVFEPNDEPLWAQVRLSIGAFMHDLFRKGAFQGSSPKDAYFVKCDRETTTQSDINLGIVNIIVGFAPLKPAEFVVISLQQMAGQIDV